MSDPLADVKAARLKSQQERADWFTKTRALPYDERCVRFGGYVAELMKRAVERPALWPDDELLRAIREGVAEFGLGPEPAEREASS